MAPVYGVKLSGQAERLGLGLLQSLDRSPAASIHERGTPGFSEAEVADQQALNAFARARFDLAQNGYVGLSAADKRLVDDTLSPTGAANDVFTADARVPLGEVWTAEGGGSLSLAGLPGQQLVGGRGFASIDRSPSLGTGLGLSMGDTGADYRNELGYLTQSGITRGTASLDHTVALGEAASTSTLGGSATVVEERDGDGQRFAELSEGLTLAGNHDLVAWGGWARYRQTGVEVDGWNAGAAYSALLSSAVQLSAAGWRDRTLDYGELVPADATTLDATLNLRPTVGTRLDLLATLQWFTPEGQATQRAARYWTRFNVQMTREWGLRLIGQTTLSPDIDAPTVAPSALVTWIRNPGTEAYLGATGRVETDGRGLTELGVFAKLSWLFRL